MKLYWGQDRMAVAYIHTYMHIYNKYFCLARRHLLDSYSNQNSPWFTDTIESHKNLLSNTAKSSNVSANRKKETETKKAKVKGQQQIPINTYIHIYNY